MWLGNGIIPDYIASDYADMTLCEMYHCTPSQLDDEDYHRTQRHLMIKSAMQAHNRNEDKTRAKRGRKH